MYLTTEEEKLLNSDNETVAKCMEILVALGEIYNAEKLIDIKSAHISGISYQNISDTGLEWLEGLNARVSVKTTVNPAGMDLLRWREMEIADEFFRNQMRIIRALENIGAEVILTCTPYYLESISFGNHLAWAESSAIIYANSVIGARTNRESGISAIASGIIGKTPYYGLHIKENRAPDVTVEINKDINISMAGYRIGNMLKKEIPIIRIRRQLNKDEIKHLGAAMAATGNAAIFHVEGQTPEWKDFDLPEEKIELDNDFEEAGCEPDLIALGCPHMSADELKSVLEILVRENRRARKNLWIFTSRKIAEMNRKIIDRIESYGAKVFSDTCMVVSPSTERYECVMVNSGKALNYLPKLRNVKVRFGNLEQCVLSAVSR
ncbi:MAG TPA: DUF521 domain-containing protein [Archaeoglobaceae archaeon]|nr:DUF521 domain-containing protein [Archaeoglobaceae archaeon]